MKTMTKKLGAIILALAMCFSLTCVAFAASDYTITIENASIDQTYAAYKIFDASYDPSTDAVTYTISKEDTLYNSISSLTDVFTLTEISGTDVCYVSVVAGVSDDTVIAALEAIGIENLINASASEKASSAGTLVLDVGEPGYYYVTSSLGGLVTIDTAHPSATVIDKNETVGEHFVKQVLDSNGDWVEAGDAAIGDELSFDISSDVPLYEGNNVVTEYVFTDTLEADSGMEIEIEIYNASGEQHLTDEGNGRWLADKSLVDQFVTMKDSNGTEYSLYDVAYNITLEFTGCTYDEESGYVVATGFVLTYYTYDVDAYESTGVFDTSNYKTDLSIDITYSTYVTSNASHNETNTATLEYYTTNFKTPTPEDPTYGGSSSSSDTVYSWDLKILKVDGEDQNVSLEGAEFTLVGESLNHVKVSTTVTYTEIPEDEMVAGVTYYYLLTTGRYTTTAPTDATADEYDSEHPGPYVRTIDTKEVIEDADTTHTADGITGSDGTLIFDGLTAGTYTLTEIVAPDGYNLLSEPIQLVIGWDSENACFTVDTGTSSGYTNATFNENGELEITVLNNSGSELPSTGGIGTTIFYIIGGVLVAGAVVVLITRRRMSSAD